MSQPYLSIIVPAYNEAERIHKTLLDIDLRLHAVDFSYEIIVVNDGSSDATASVVQGVSKLVRGVRLIDLPKNVGKGGAVREGMLQAKGVIRIFTDADNSTSIDQFEKMMPFFKEGYSLVIGSRVAKGARLEPAEPLYRQLLGKGLNLIVQAVLLPGVWDTQCGFKAFTAEAAEAVFSATKVARWGFDFEALAIANCMGYRIKEVPVRWVNDQRSHMSFSGGLQFLGDIFKVRWWLWRKQYAFLHPSAVQQQ